MPRMHATPRARAASEPMSSHGAGNGLSTEPNPFEQSFSASSIPDSRTRSTAEEAKPKEPTITPRRARSQSPGNGLRLPSLSALASPTIGTSDAWAIDSSLRSGPLSPAMLHGPTPGIVSAGFGSTFANLFDANSFRTGLTPGINGVTSTATSFAPSSPNTQALFAMMTNHVDSPNPASSSNHDGSAVAAKAQHRINAREPNHFELGFSTAMQSASRGQPTNGALGQLPYYGATQSVPRPINFSQISSAPIHMQAGNLFGQDGMRVGNNSAVHPSALSNKASAPQDSRYLYSQPKVHEQEDDVIAAGVLSALNTGYGSSDNDMGNLPAIVERSAHTSPEEDFVSYAGPTTKKGKATGTNGDVSSGANTRKRKASSMPTAEEMALVDPTVPPPAPRGRKKGSTNKKVKKMAVEDDDMDGSINGDDKLVFENDEDKRKNFLERNRQAALKCRQRKKAWLQSLQSKVELLTADNDSLQSTIQGLKEEVVTLRAILASHKDCGLHAYGGQSTGTVHGY